MPDVEELKQDKPFAEEFTRGQWISVGFGGLWAILALVIGGTFFPALAACACMVCLARGFWPRWFHDHIEPQLIAGTPYERRPSKKKWITAVGLCLLIAAIVTAIRARWFPDKPDLADLIVDRVIKGLLNVPIKKPLSLDEQFPLGYAVCSFADGEFLPFQGMKRPLFVHWERNRQSWSRDGDRITIRLPNIEVGPNLGLHDATVVMPAKVGSAVVFRIDPEAFQRGAAIASNSFELSPGEDIKKELDARLAGSKKDFNLDGFPGDQRIDGLANTIVAWATGNYYRMGAIDQSVPLVRLNGGILVTSNPNVFAEAGFVRQNRFIGGPRGGYIFPKATTILGNDFVESRFDASRLPDGAIVSGNRFKSVSGVYQIGPTPEIELVIKIYEPNAMLVGARPIGQDSIGR